MDEFSAIYDNATSSLQSLGSNAWHYLTGAAFAAIVLLLFRLITRALLQSYMGARTGKFVSGALEITISAVIASLSYKNPGAILMALAWGAAIFNQLIRVLRG